MASDRVRDVVRRFRDRIGAKKAVDQEGLWSSAGTEAFGHTSALLRGFIQTRLVEAIGPKLEDRSHSARRAGFALSMLIGVIVGRCIVKVSALVEVDHETVVRPVGPAIQTMLTGDGIS